MRKFLWAILFASIITMLPSIYLRVTNENSNNSIILAGRLADYSSNSGESSSVSLITPEKLKTSGLSAVIIEENEVSSENGTSGVEIQDLEMFYRNRFEIIIHLQTLSHSDKFYDQLAYTIDKFNVKHILVCPALQGSNSRTTISGDKKANADTSALKEIIAKNKLTVFIMENKEQNGFIEVPGLKSLIPEIGYRINRAFSISNSILGKTNLENAVYVWLRSVIDRNIRMIVISSSDILKQNEGFTEESLHSVNKLQALLLQRGVAVNSILRPLNTSLPGIASKIPIFINLFAAIALYLHYLFSVPRVSVHRASLTYIITLFIISLLAFLFIYSRGDIGTAFISALVYPSLSSLLMLRYLNKQKDSNDNLINLIKKFALSLLILLSTSYIGAAVVISSMSDIRYMMHLVNYNIVNLAYILPLLMFVLNFIICREIPVRFNRFNRKNILFYTICAFSLIAILFLYTERSGNSSLVPASTLELEARKLLETFFYTRPRIKEFLIGYPALFIFIYSYRKNSSNRLLFITGLLSSITGISIINSFCHGFTPAATSLARSVEGLLAGTIFGITAIFIFKWLRKKLTLLKIRKLYNRIGY